MAVPKSELPYIEWEDDSGQARRIYADAWQSENITLPAAVTEHEVEEGANITDHYRIMPEGVSVSMFFSNTPTRGDLGPVKGVRGPVAIEVPTPPAKSLLTPGGLTSGIVGGVTDLLGGRYSPPSSLDVLHFEEPYNRISDVFDKIQEIRLGGILVTVSTSVAIFENMAIPNARIVRDENSSPGEGTLELELVRIRFVQSDVTIAVPLPTEPRGQGAKNAGAKGTDQLEGEGPKASAAKSILNSTGITSAGSGI